MKITMYELLGRVKDGKAPKKIKHKDLIFTYNEENKDYETQLDDNSGVFLFNLVYITPILNDTVEILEEDKKIPEKIPLSSYHNSTDDIKEKVLINKINEIIDYLKSKGE